MQYTRAYEEKYPETKHGRNEKVRNPLGKFDSQSCHSGDSGDDPNDSKELGANEPEEPVRRYSRYISDATGISERTIQRQAHLTEALGAAALPDLGVTSEHSNKHTKIRYFRIAVISAYPRASASSTGMRPSRSAIDLFAPASTSTRTVSMCRRPPSPSTIASMSAVQPRLLM